MFDSVRIRLTLLYTGVLALVLIFLSAGTYWLIARTTERRTFISLAEISQGFLTTLQSEYKGQLKERAGPEALHTAALESADEFRLRDHRFAVLDSAGNVLAENQALPAPQAPAGAASQPEIPGEVLRHLIAGTAGAPRRLQDLMLGGEHFRARVLQGKVGGSTISIVTLQSVEAERSLLEDIREALFGVIPIALVIASVGGYFLARKSLAPVVAMSEKAARMGAQNLHERLPVLNPRDELGYLASTFNDLVERLTRSLEQQRRFMADASHELRSPVSIIRGEAEVALSQARTPEEYRGSLAIALDEARRLSQIVDDLFTLARADAGQYPLRPRDFYLEELAVECVRASRNMAAARGITLSYEPDAEMPIHGDEALVRRLTMNLLDNAIKYTPEGGKINVACQRAGSEYSLTVRDSGPGILAEAQEKIFERFFRLDPARTQNRRALGTAETAAPATTGAGLGLAIARWIAEAHHGRLVLVHSDASGSTFAAFLPANGAAAAESTDATQPKRESTS
jgi:two-component system OmpR family sensor kinase